jgi:ABC-type branched-subunit amino acid transport system ATPase component
VRRFPLALGAVAGTAGYQAYALLVLAPDVSDSLGTGRVFLAAAAAFAALVSALAGLGLAAIARRHHVRLALAAAIGWVVCTALTATVTAVWPLLLAAATGGALAASVRALHPALVFADAGSEPRRSLAAHAAAASITGAAGMAVVAALGERLTWRVSFLLLGGMTIAAVLPALRLPDRDAPHADLRMSEAMRRLMLIPTVRLLATAYAAVGMLLFPVTASLLTLFDRRWGLGFGARGWTLAALAPFAVVVIALAGTGRLHVNPGVLLATTAACLLVGVFVPFRPVAFILLAVATASVAALLPLMDTMLLAVAPQDLRTHAGALSGAMLAGPGTVGGLLFLSTFEPRFGVSVALALLAVPVLGAALLVRRATECVEEDVRRLTTDAVPDSSGALLACRQIDFAYGPVQVLFGVDFTVRAGEMVALLGTNGAGKTTLLNVISGLGLPMHGSIHYDGSDVTYLEAERRLELGIAQISGGRAVFRSMTVLENLRVFGHALRRNRTELQRGIDESLEVFPKLRERSRQRAGTLSGGEQQMLALAKAFIQKPKLLLVDELSLGLAPKVVAELLEMVKRINANGAAVVLVEQSVNVALTLVDHAYFMERGEIRFDGKAKELLARPDLLRAVFLEGARRR